jgi:hypothetical protein
MVRSQSCLPSSIATVSAVEHWQVILDGALRERALEIVRTIAGSLESLPLESANLASGSAGLAVCFAYLAEGLAEPRYKITGRRLLDQAITMAEAEPMLPSLYGGLAGIGWAASHLNARLHGPDLEATLTEIDETACDCLNTLMWQDDYCLSSGLVGLGLYALERLGPGAGANQPAAMHILERVVGHLLATVERKPDPIVSSTGWRRRSGFSGRPPSWSCRLAASCWRRRCSGPTAMESPAPS